MFGKYTVALIQSVCVIFSNSSNVLLCFTYFLSSKIMTKCQSCLVVTIVSLKGYSDRTWSHNRRYSTWKRIVFRTTWHVSAWETVIHVFYLSCIHHVIIPLILKLLTCILSKRNCQRSLRAFVNTGKENYLWKFI